MRSTSRRRGVYGGEYASTGLHLFVWWKKNRKRGLQKPGSGSAQIRSSGPFGLSLFIGAMQGFIKPNVLCTFACTTAKPLCPGSLALLHPIGIDLIQIDGASYAGCPSSPLIAPIRGETRRANPNGPAQLEGDVCRLFQSYGSSVQPIRILIHVLNSKLFKTKNIQIQNCSKPKMFKFKIVQNRKCSQPNMFKFKIVQI
jgi:hypothetical protein